MTFVARPLTDEELAAVRADHSAAEDLLLGDDDLDDVQDDGDLDDDAEEDAGDDPFDPVVDLDKAWHGIHFLLTGTAWDAETVLGLAILGGIPLEDTDIGYGPVRLLEPDQVEAVAAALAGVDDEALRERFDPAELAKADIYPDIWAEGQSVLEDFLLPYLGELRELYTTAAFQGRAVIAGIC